MKRSLKIVLFFILIIILALLFYLIRNIIIFNNFKNANNRILGNNYKVEEVEENGKRKITYIFKDGIRIHQNDDRYLWFDDNNRYLIIPDSQEYIIVPLNMPGPWFDNNVSVLNFLVSNTLCSSNAFSVIIGKEKINNVEYITIGNKNGKVYLDENYKIKKELFNEIMYNYNIEVDTVTDEEVKMPDLINFKEIK